MQSDPTELDELRERVRGLEGEVDTLEAQLDREAERAPVRSRLNLIAKWARRLELEYHDHVGLDLEDLTVVADTAPGPDPPPAHG